MKGDPNIPDTGDVQRALLFYLADLAAPRTAQEVYRALAEQFGLSLSQRTRRMPNQAEPHWHNRVRTAKIISFEKGWLIIPKETNGL